MTPEGCSLYELDFFRESNFSLFNYTNDRDLCYFLGNMSYDALFALSIPFGSYYPEYQFVNNISGKNVMEKIGPLDDPSRYNSSDCSMS